MDKNVALIFANGEFTDGEMVACALSYRAALRVAADGGARHMMRLGLQPDIVIGDMDSLTRDELDTLVADGADVERHPKDKDETDLEIALKWTASQNIQKIFVLGALGGRLDQLFSNVHLLALPQLTDIDVYLVDGKQRSWLIRPGSHIITGEKGDTLSLIPVAGSAANVHTQNLHYPLNGETLSFGPARGISNVLDAPSATVSFTEGMLLVVHTIGRA